MMARRAATVEGIPEVRRAMKNMPKELRREFNKDLKQAADLAAAEVRAAVPQQSGAAAASVRTVHTGKFLGVRAGSKNVPYYGWLDFGGTLKPSGGRRNTIERERVKDGRYLFPIALQQKARVVESARWAVLRAKRRLRMA